MAALTSLTWQYKQNKTITQPLGLQLLAHQSFLIPRHQNSEITPKYPYSPWKVIAEGVGDLKHQNYLNWNFKRGGVGASNQKNVYESGLSRKFEADREHF